MASSAWRWTIVDFGTVWASMFVLRSFLEWASPAVDHVYWYLLFLPLIWVSFLRGFGGSVTATFAVASGAVWFIQPPVTSVKVFDLQVLVVFLSLTTLVMGAAVSSQRAAQRGLRRQNLELMEVKSQLEARNRELESRRKELSAFLRSIFHDFKNPLVTIGGFVGRLEKELEEVMTPNVRSSLDVPRYHEKVFDLFDKLDRESEGTGVGLSVVKRIVEEHGGRIWVESQGQGLGTTMCFTLG
jgi:signal transduction histidine kinase